MTGYGASAWRVGAGRQRDSGALEGGSGGDGAQSGWAHGVHGVKCDAFGGGKVIIRGGLWLSGERSG